MLKEGSDSRLRLPRGGLGVVEPHSSLWDTASGRGATDITCREGNSDEGSGKIAQSLPPKGGSAIAAGPQGG